ncbi:MAG: gliding motility lipoprotein GldH [Bacteroidetes bacterium]|nr:gliding motility lipoprotein GldH [Bacteroidota bacterium]
MKTRYRIALTLVLIGGLLAGCSTADLYEKTVAIPGHSWESRFKPSFTFNIKDTTAGYQLFLILRHTDKYSFNNIWLNLTIQAPGTTAPKSFKFPITLANDDRGWLATGMDDIYEHQESLNNILVNNDISFRTPGTYTFTLEQVMREDPLNHVLNAGLRIEKIK